MEVYNITITNQHDARKTIVTKTNDYDVMRRTVISHIMNVIMNETGKPSNYHAALTDFNVIQNKYPHVYKLVNDYVDNLMPMSFNDDIIDDDYGIKIHYDNM